MFARNVKEKKVWSRSPLVRILTLELYGQVSVSVANIYALAQTRIPTVKLKLLPNLLFRKSHPVS